MVDIFNNVNATAQNICYYIANKLAFVDFQEILFAGLYYFDKDSELVLISNRIDKLTPYLKIIFNHTPPKYFVLLLENMYNALIEAWVRYLVVFIALEDTEIVDRFSKIIETDLVNLNAFLCYRDENNHLIGLEEIYTSEYSEKIQRASLYFCLRDDDLIELFKKVDNDVHFNKEIISRILFKRKSREVDDFFKAYKGIFQK